MRARHTILPIFIAVIASIVALAVVTLTVRATRPRHPPTRQVPAAVAAPAIPDAPASSPTPPVPVLPAEAWVSWAYSGPAGDVTGAQPGTSSTESMIKPGIAADYLHGLEAAGRDPTGAELDLLTRMIRDSDDGAAQQLYLAGGGDDMVKRIVAGCGLRDAAWAPGWWAKTALTAVDAVRYGECIRDGKLVSPRWTGWILEQMRAVRGEGRFGIIDFRSVDRGVPVAIKNGWTWREDGKWHVNCLAVTDRWTLAVLTRYPADLGLPFGADICRTVAAAVLPPAGLGGRARYE